MIKRSGQYRIPRNSYLSEAKQKGKDPFLRVKIYEEELSLFFSELDLMNKTAGELAEDIREKLGLNPKRFNSFHWFKKLKNDFHLSNDLTEKEVLIKLGDKIKEKNKENGK